MITDDDIKKMSRVFVTKKDLDQFATKKDLKETRETLVVEIFKSREEAKKDNQELQEKFDNKFDRVLNGLDKVVGELKTMREEQASHHLQHEDIDRDLAAIKAVPSVAHDLNR